MAVAVAALPGAGGAATAVERVAPSGKLGRCAGFPRPRRSLPATAPSLPNQAAWKQDISRAPLDPRSNAYIAYINAHGGDHLHPDFGSPRAYGIPYRIVGRRAGRSRVRFTAYGDESTHGPYRIPRRSPIEGGERSDGDRHVIVVDRYRCRLYELYRAFHRKGRNWNADSGVIWNLRKVRLRRDGYTSADAAGLPIFPGLVRFDEIRRGRINHAIRVTFESTQHAWIHPASHCAGDSSSLNAPPMGLRLRLRAGYPVGGLPRPAKIVARALKRYGMIVADNGSNWFISGTSDRRWPDGKLNALKSIPGSAFEVVRSRAGLHRC